MSKKLITFVSLTAFVFILAGCGAGSANMPYEPDTPAPDPHVGKFVSDHGEMSFNGDGISVEIDFDDELSALTGLPSGKQEGNYAFLSGNLPPAGSVEIRYDVAHEIRISTSDVSTVLELGIAAEDGSTATVGTNVVTSERIPLLFEIEGRNVTILFEKSN
ncbi:MAG: hypothetical protein J6N21_12105 [Butyrivibrio sp.]|nr:hypothetical protein [Butyrivibrio sp.]